MRRRRDDRQSVANTLSNLGPLLAILGDCSGAIEALSECLRLCLELGDKRDAVYALKSLADLAAQQGQPRRAVCLFSAEAALRSALGMPRVPFREAEHQKVLAVLRLQMPPDVFCRAWAEGQALPWEEAVAYALINASA